MKNPQNIPEEAKKATNSVSLPVSFSGLFGPVRKWVEAQILRDLRVVWGCRKHLVAFPTAKRYHANRQPASRFRLEDSQLEAAAPEVTADCRWSLWDLYATVAGW